MQALDSIRHDNILSVYGFSLGEGLGPCIVYQLMENGSLEDRLQCKVGQNFLLKFFLNVSVVRRKELRLSHGIKDMRLLEAQLVDFSFCTQSESGPSSTGI
jgi:hypothetical protein